MVNKFATLLALALLLLLQAPEVGGIRELRMFSGSGQFGCGSNTDCSYAVTGQSGLACNMGNRLCVVCGTAGTAPCGCSAGPGQFCCTTDADCSYAATHQRGLACNPSNSLCWVPPHSAASPAQQPHQHAADPTYHSRNYYVYEPVPTPSPPHVPTPSPTQPIPAPKVYYYIPHDATHTKSKEVRVAPATAAQPSRPPRSHPKPGLTPVHAPVVPAKGSKPSATPLPTPAPISKPPSPAKALPVAPSKARPAPPVPAGKKTGKSGKEHMETPAPSPPTAGKAAGKAAPGAAAVTDAPSLIPVTPLYPEPSPPAKQAGAQRPPAGEDAVVPQQPTEQPVIVVEPVVTTAKPAVPQPARTPSKAPEVPKPLSEAVPVAPLYPDQPAPTPQPNPAPPSDAVPVAPLYPEGAPTAAPVEATVPVPPPPAQPALIPTAAPTTEAPTAPSNVEAPTPAPTVVMDEPLDDLEGDAEPTAAPGELVPVAPLFPEAPTPIPEPQTPAPTVFMDEPLDDSEGDAEPTAAPGELVPVAPLFPEPSPDGSAIVLEPVISVTIPDGGQSVDSGDGRDRLVPELSTANTGIACPGSASPAFYSSVPGYGYYPGPVGIYQPGYGVVPLQAAGGC